MADRSTGLRLLLGDVHKDPPIDNTDGIGLERNDDGRPQGLAGFDIEPPLMERAFDDAIDDVKWIKEHGLKGGVLIPNIPPNTDWVKPLYHPDLDRFWEVCEDLELIVTTHSGTGSPDYGNFALSGGQHSDGVVSNGGGAVAGRDPSGANA